MGLDADIKMVEYMTELPKRELLEQKLHKAVESARKRLEGKSWVVQHGDIINFCFDDLCAVQKSRHNLVSML